MVTDSLRKVFGNVYILYFKAHSFHWNVEGPDFVQYHNFLGDFYQDLHGSVDTIAELIRTLDVYAPTSLNRAISLSDISELDTIPNRALDMMNIIKSDNDVVIASLMIAYEAAEKEGELGISNFLQDRIQTHQKHSWMLRSITK